VNSDIEVYEPSYGFDAFLQDLHHMQTSLKPLDGLFTRIDIMLCGSGPNVLTNFPAFGRDLSTLNVSYIDRRERKEWETFGSGTELVMTISTSSQTVDFDGSHLSPCP
jgi:hypothetical protein